MGLRGTAFVFGDEINTSVVAPSEMFEAFEGGELTEESLEYLFAPIAPEFNRQVEDGDIVVAGEHFGGGSARDTATVALKQSGVAAVVASSFARIFYRNAIAIGFPVFISPDVPSLISEGDTVEIDVERAIVRNRATGVTADIEPHPEALREIVDAGGLLEHYDQYPEGLSLEE